jgi:hypothetical protein
MDSDFDLFDFAREQENVPLPQETETPVPAAPAPLKVLSKAELRQAAMAFLATLKPAGIAANVPTRRSKYRVAAAGFWRPENHRKNHTVTKTAIVVMYDDLDCCFSDCATRDERISAITKLQEEKEALEADIRQNEPHLASADDLFGDFRTWDYASSNNTAYRKVCRKLDKEVRLLTQGSKLEYIRRAGNADLCFLAVPENLIDPAVIPIEWGVVELTANPRGFKLLRNAMRLSDITPEGRLQLALNVASAAAKSACFASGVDADGKMRRPPKRRR